MVDAPDARIRRDEFIRELGDRFHGSSIPQKWLNASMANVIEGCSVEAGDRGRRLPAGELSDE
jgi:hypothetical protein